MHKQTSKMQQRWKRPNRCYVLPLIGVLVASGLLEKHEMLLSWNLTASSHLGISEGHPAKLQQTPFAIRKIEQSRKIYPTNAQMGSEQIDHILDVLSPTGNLLVWGLGNDSPYWHNVTSGKVMFLEDDFPLKKDGILWYDHILNRFPFLTAYQVHYSTENSISDFSRYMTNPWTPQLEIDNYPSDVLNTVWDVIIVDAPLGCCGMGPARFQSLYMTMKIVQKQLQNKLSDKIHVFVDDYERKIEREFSQRVFGEKHPFEITNRSAGVSNANQQAHFIFDGNDCVVDESCSLSRSGSGRWMILMTVNDGYFDFFLNWLSFYKNISEIQHVPVTVFAEDDTVMKKLLNDPRIPSRFDLERSKLELTRTTGIRATAQDTRALDYESPNYLKMVSTRASLILEKLKSGFHVLYSDVDTVWRSNPFPYFDTMIDKEIDFMGQTDDLPGETKYPYYCTGFLAVRLTEQSKVLMKEWGKALSKPQLNQPIFNELVRKITSLQKLKHQPLPPVKFPHGGTYFNPKNWQKREMAVVIHNNYVVGHDVKKSRFQLNNLWFVHDVSNLLNDTEGSLATMFLTTHPTKVGTQKYFIQTNTIQALALLKPEIRAVVFSKDFVIEKFCRPLGIRVIKDYKTNAYGTPFLKEMFQQLEYESSLKSKFIGYLNADIVFDRWLLATLHVIWKARMDHKLLRRIFITGRRTNVKMDSNLSENHTDRVKPESNMRSMVHRMKRRGSLFQTNAQDYFIITPGTLDWRAIPDFVVGRPGYDNWLVDHVFHESERISLIDTTGAITAIHQTGADGNLAGHKKRIDLEWNRKRGDGMYDHGHTTFAQWSADLEETGRSKPHRVVLQRRQKRRQ